MKLNSKLLFLLLVILTLIAILYYNTTIYPKIIWIYWDSKELPRVVQQTRDYNKDKFKGWDVRWLNDTTVNQYIPANMYPNNYITLIPAHKSDWIRLYLLHTYGGCWLDAGIIINSKEAFDDIYNQSILKTSQLTVFKTSASKATFKHSSGVDLPLVIDNWYILCPKNSLIVKMWFDEFTYAINIGLLNYKRQVINEGTDISKIHFKNEEDVYLTEHICIQHILQKKVKTLPSMYILHSADSMFKLQDICKWKHDCIIDKLNNDPISRQLPYIKLTSDTRKANIDGFFIRN